MNDLSQKKDKMRKHIKIWQRMPEIDKHGYTEILLWKFIEIFGSYISQGNDPVCDIDSIMILCE